MAASPKATILVVELKNRPASFIRERVDQARTAGLTSLKVLNRGQPILRLGLAADMPDEWREHDPEDIQISDLKRGQVSLVGMRRDQRPCYLTQHGKPVLALWPITPAKDAGKAAGSALTGSQARQLAEMEARVQKLEAGLQRAHNRIARIEQDFMFLGKVAARLARPKPKKGRKAAPKATNEEGETE